MDAAEEFGGVASATVEAMLPVSTALYLILSFFPLFLHRR